MSTILGTLIFIGIIFSAYIPMTLVMKQADNIYEREVHDIKALDIEREKEKVVVYGYSETSSEDLTVFIQNRGTAPVKIVRVWTNDTPHEESESINSLFAVSLGPYTVSETGSPMKLKVTTENGNTFSCNLGPIYWNSQYGWYTPSLGVSIMILNEWGQYEIILKDGATPEKNEVGYYKSSGNEADDISKTFLVGSEYSTYYVTVKQRSGGNWVPLIGPDFAVDVPSEAGNPVVYVVVDGR